MEITAAHTKSVNAGSESGSFQGQAGGAWTPRHFEKGLSRHEQSASDAAHASSKKGKPAHEYSLGEEIANSVTHGIGALLAIAAIVLCTVVAVRHGGGLRLASALIYSITMLLEYVMSTLYHAISATKAKSVFKVLDHSFIYLFIAGSYTPFCLVSLYGSGGLGLAVLVWAVAIIGVALEAFWVYRPRWISAVIYLILGWAVVWYIPTLIHLVDPMCFILLLVGGLLYSIGSVFYVLKKIPYMHTVFHLFILAASVFQFLSILLFVL